MHILQVGKPYLPGKRSLPTGTNYNFRGGTHELLLLLDGITPRELESVRAGAAEFALLVFKRVIFFLYRFEPALEWSDCPYSVWLVTEAERQAPRETSAETRALLQVALVDANKNTVLALRALTLSPEFTGELHAAINAQLSAEISLADYDAAIQQAYLRWPNSEQMLRQASVRAKGGK